jgi:hypothetical protein
MKPILLIITMLPFLVSAQSNPARETVFNNLAGSECDNRIFTKVEQPPILQGGETALADSLESYFYSRKAKVSGSATYKFILTRSTDLMQIEKVEGELSSSEIFKEGLLHFKDLWVPAVQNARKVCFEVKLHVDFKNGEALLSMKQ